MQIIAHRRNKIEELKATPSKYGIEVDIRSYGSRLVVSHEVFVDAVNFEEWVRHYTHKILILNIKEEGIEYHVKDIVESHGITNYFFLDLSFPFLVKMINTGESRVAVRFSEYESIETALALVGKVDWVWVDYFTKMPLTSTAYETLSKYFKICLVSPELLGKDFQEINVCKKLISSFRFDAVCTKRCDLWNTTINV